MASIHHLPPPARDPSWAREPRTPDAWIEYLMRHGAQDIARKLLAEKRAIKERQQ